MSQRCGSSEPTPTPQNGLATKPRKTRRNVIEGNADTIIRQTIVKKLPRTASVAGGARRKRRYDKANDGQKPSANRQRGGGGARRKKRIEGERRRYDKGSQRQNPPAGHHRGGGDSRQPGYNFDDGNTRFVRRSPRPCSEFGEGTRAPSAVPLPVLPTTPFVR